jgi:cyanophycin synthetase
VRSEQIHVIPPEPEALETMLGMAEPNDLLLIFGADVTRCWKQIIYFKPKWGAPDGSAKPAETASEPSLSSLYPDLVTDERGVRIKRR